MDHPEFPSDETLAAFIDGRADAETRKRVIEHMVGCNDCYATFQAASEMRERSAERVVPFPRRRVAVIVTVAAAAAIVFLLFFTPILRPPAKTGLPRPPQAPPPPPHID